MVVPVSDRLEKVGFGGTSFGSTAMVCGSWREKDANDSRIDSVMQTIDVAARAPTNSRIEEKSLSSAGVPLTFSTSYTSDRTKSTMVVPRIILVGFHIAE